MQDINNESTIRDIKEKIKNNPKYLHPCNKEFQEEAKRLGLSGNELTNKYRKEGRIKPADSSISNRDNWNTRSSRYSKYDLHRKDYNNKKEYFRDYVRKKRHMTGENLPMEDNESCSSHLGVQIGEIQFGKNFLSIIFEYVEHMNYGTLGFDFICKDPRQEFINKYPDYKLERCKEYKVQIKTRSVTFVNKSETYSGYMFMIRYNKPDIFILVGFEKRQDLYPSAVWMFLKNSIIREKEIWKRDTFSITNNQKGFNEFDKFQLKEELKMFIK